MGEEEGKVPLVCSLGKKEGNDNCTALSSSVNEYYKATNGNVQMWMLTQVDFSYEDFVKQIKQVLLSDILCIVKDREGSRQSFFFFRGNQIVNCIGTIAPATSSQKSRFAPNPAVLMSLFFPYLEVL